MKLFKWSVIPTLQLQRLKRSHNDYTNIIATKGVAKQEICSYIFATREAAENHRREIETTLSFRFVETVSFRSRKVSVDMAVKS